MGCICASGCIRWLATTNGGRCLIYSPLSRIFHYCSPSFTSLFPFSLQEPQCEASNQQGPTWVGGERTVTSGARHRRVASASDRRGPTRTGGVRASGARPATGRPRRGQPAQGRAVRGPTSRCEWCEGRLSWRNGEELWRYMLRSAELSAALGSGGTGGAATL
ncbi:hypothetical protein SETIT_2G166200v2 [Setaria italica]|uniref:Uncharacterized protein n=1 Tax=Setaria italica TaxID=4555 RepID=A0A368Q1S3_SETIT|nr:hypothetical protein SETIT_2G166200v2 [Setaria italica]